MDKDLNDLDIVACDKSNVKTHRAIVYNKAFDILSEGLQSSCLTQVSTVDLLRITRLETSVRKHLFLDLFFVFNFTFKEREYRRH